MDFDRTLHSTNFMKNFHTDNNSIPLENNKNTFIIDDYEIGDIMASGEYFSVRLAKHIPTGRRVAAKLLNTKSKYIESGVNQNEVEVKNLKQIGPHPNVVQLLYSKPNTSYILPVQERNTLKSNLFSISTNNSTNTSNYDSTSSGPLMYSPLTVLEYLPHFDVCDHLLAEGNFPEDITCFLFNQLLDGLIHIHSMGIIHRDLKPEQLVFDELFNLKIIDFGLSATIGKTNESHRVGTNMYMSPEIYRRSINYTLNNDNNNNNNNTNNNNTFHNQSSDRVENGDIAIDVYGAGCCLFLFLFGFPPFTSASPSCGLYKAFTTRPELFWSRVESRRGVPLSPHVKDLLTQLLNPIPQNRINLQAAKNCYWMKINIHDHFDQAKDNYYQYMSQRWDKFINNKNDQTRVKQLEQRQIFYSSIDDLNLENNKNNNKNNNDLISDINNLNLNNQ